MKVRYSNQLAAAIVVAISTPQVSVAQSTQSSTNGQQEIEEIVVSGAFKTTKAETLLPISVITTVMSMNCEESYQFTGRHAKK